MALTRVEATVTGPTGESVAVELLVDSGAMYSLLPDGIWQQIELAPKRTMRFTLADGTTIERRISECHFALAGVDGHSPVVLGEPGDEALLGTVTLEVMGLMLNPFTRTLEPMRMLLA